MVDIPGRQISVFEKLEYVLTNNLPFMYVVTAKVSCI